MAMTDAEREKIIEEERVRWTARRVLLEEAWAQNGHGCRAGINRRHGLRLLFWLPVLGLIVWGFSHGTCHF